jgi:DNA-binding response OmpR family regulator
MGETRALDMHIKALRQKLKEANSEVKIETVYGIGYKIGII